MPSKVTASTVSPSPRLPIWKATAIWRRKAAARSWMDCSTCDEVTRLQLPEPKTRVIGDSQVSLVSSQKSSAGVSVTARGSGENTW